MVITFNPRSRKKASNLCEFKVSLVHRGSSKTTQRKHCLGRTGGIHSLISIIQWQNGRRGKVTVSTGCHELWLGAPTLTKSLMIKETSLLGRDRLFFLNTKFERSSSCQWTVAEVAVQLYLIGLMLETESSGVLVCISVTHFIRKGKLTLGKARPLP